MNEPSVTYFERAFGPNDMALFHDLTLEFIGKPLSRFRETYAEGIVLDCGELVPKRNSTRSSLARDRGEWMVSSWGCDVSLSMGPSTSRVDTFEHVKTLLTTVVGRRLVAVSIDAPDLSLTLVFDGGSEVLFRTDRDDPQLDQWFITTPLGQTIGTAASGAWYFREP
jgi:hypothetical protein